MAQVPRRDALRLMGSAPLAFGFGLGAAEAQVVHERVSRALKAAEGGAYAPKFFSAHEWRTVQVLVDLILPRDERSGSATDAGVPEFMDFVMTDPLEEPRTREARQVAMRGGLAWIDTESRRRFGRDFADATDAQRFELLDSIAYSTAEDEEEEEEDDEWALPEGDPRQPRLRHGPSFFNAFRDLTASGFWSSQMGVQDLGYVGNTGFPWQGPPSEVLRKLGIEEP